MPVASGLFKSTIDEKSIKNLIIEGVGTFILTFVGAGTVVNASLGRTIAGAPPDSLTVALSFGLTLLVLVTVFGNKSGAHFNPAVTIALMIRKKFPPKYALKYIASQFTGGLLAAYFLEDIDGPASVTKALLGAPSPTPGTSTTSAFLAEAFIGFILVLAIFAVATGEELSVANMAIVIGVALAVAVLIGGPTSGGSANPARAFGPELFAWHFTAWYIYLIAPIVGGSLAGTFYDLVARDTTPPSPAES